MSTTQVDIESQRPPGLSALEFERYDEEPLRRRISRHVRLDVSPRPFLSTGDRPWGTGSSIYYRSRSPSGISSPLHTHYSSGRISPVSGVSSPRPSMRSISTARLHALLENLELEQYDTFDVEELRDGFFDAAFYRPKKGRRNSRRFSESGTNTPVLPAEQTTFSKPSPLNLKAFLKAQKDDLWWFFDQAFTTRLGLNVFKSALAYWIAFVLNIIPTLNNWLGRYPYFAVIAVILNHPGRSFGSQLEGTILCCLGPALGLAFGTLAQELAHISNPAYAGKAGILTCFMIIVTFIAAWIRCYWLRLYQLTITALVAFFFVLLELTDEDGVGWWRREKLRDFAVPWGIGIALCQIINLVVFPSTGSRDIAVAMHNAIGATKKSLVIPRTPSSSQRRQMTLQLVNLSEAARDLRLEISCFSIKPHDLEQLRNLLQAVVRDSMGIDPATELFNSDDESTASTTPTAVPILDENGEPLDDQDYTGALPYDDESQEGEKLVKRIMAGPARKLLDQMKTTLCAADGELLRLANHPDLVTGDVPDHSLSIEDHLHLLQASIQEFDAADRTLFASPDLPKTFSGSPEIVELFLFTHPLRKAANSIFQFARKVAELKSLPNAGKRMLLWPSYPWERALFRVNKQVRHDRGGLSAGLYFHTKKQIVKEMNMYAAKKFIPSPRQDETGAYEDTHPEEDPVIVNLGGVGPQGTAKPSSFRYRLWSVMHRLQEFEARFALKATVLTALLSIPAWLGQSSGWWNANEAWWAVIIAWLMMHPRVGGNFRDLVTRTVSAIVGAVWGGLAYFAADGNPYVMAVFAAVFAFPAIFRLTSSSHPRSGLIACLAFTIVALSVNNDIYAQDPFHVAWTRSCVIIVGTVSAVVVNWVLWPFVARHELRKSLSLMMLHLGIYYRVIVAKYIYHDGDTVPTPEDIASSEVTEAHLREALIRMHELLEMTEHEIRIRGPFDQKPYLALLHAMEHFFERLVQVRQSSLYFQSSIARDTEEANRRLISARRDAVASILLNLYILSGALRTNRAVPKYLPSAPAARKRLLDRMEELESDSTWETLAEYERSTLPDGDYRPWAGVYQYAFSAALTDIVEVLETLQQLTKEIVGEMALDVSDMHKRY